MAGEGRVAAASHLGAKGRPPKQTMELVHKALVHQLAVVILDPDRAEDVVGPVSIVLAAAEAKEAALPDVARLSLEAADPAIPVDARDVTASGVVDILGGVSCSGVSELALVAVQLADEGERLGMGVVLLGPLLLGDGGLVLRDRVVVVLLEVAA